MTFYSAAPPIAQHWAYQVLLDRMVRRDIPLRQVDPDSVAVDAAVAVEEELQMQLDSVLLPSFIS